MREFGSPRRTRRKRNAEGELCMFDEESGPLNPDARRRATMGSPALVTA